MYDKRISKKQRQQITKARRSQNNGNVRESQKYLNALKQQHYRDEILVRL